MRYIEKLQPPSSFEKQYKIYKEENSDITRDIFEDFKRDAHLGYNGENKKFILEEQKGLCGYCERKITEKYNDSHIEHIESLNKSPKLGIDYDNLLISCNGADNDSKNCGHKKDNEKLPLSPIQDKDISDYFIFDKESGEIIPSQKDKEKAEITINILNLNTKRLDMQRLQAKKLLREHFPKYKQKKLSKNDMMFKEGFVSYLIYCYNIT